MGVFSKFAAALIAIPSSVLGGMTTFLFCSVAVSGISIIAKGVPFNRRNRFILTAGLALGYGATLVPNYFSNVFSYQGDNKALQGFLEAIVLVMETGLAVTAIVCMILNGLLPFENEDLPQVVHAVHQSKENDLGQDTTASRAESDEIQPAEKAKGRVD